MEQFLGNNIEETPKQEAPQEQEVAILEQEEQNVELYADTILNAAKNNGYEFLRATQAQIERYAKGEHDEQRSELFPHWSSEKLKELNERINQKIKEDLIQNNQ